MPDRKPSNLLWTWLGFIDANGLSDEEGDHVARFDIEDDAQLEVLVENWIRPKFLEMNDISKRSFREILEHSDSWPRDEVRAVFDDFNMPSGQKIKDVPRFLNALRRASRD